MFFLKSEKTLNMLRILEHWLQCYLQANMKAALAQGMANQQHQNTKHESTMGPTYDWRGYRIITGVPGGTEAEAAACTCGGPCDTDGWWAVE